MSFFISSLYKAKGIPQTKNEKAFDSYRFYLSCLVKDLGQTHRTIESFAKYAWGQCNLAPSKSILDNKLIRRFLVIAWNTEYLTRTNVSQEIDIIKVSNQWRVIQAYYSIYSAGEAVVYVLDGVLVESHAKCISKLNNFFVDRKHVSPWSFAYMGSIRQGFVSKNFPSNAKPVNNLSRLEMENVDLVATCLRAEHRNRIDDYEPQKLSKKQKKEGQKKTFKIDHKPGYTTILNFLYRLRIKSNYKDAEIFTVDSPDEYVKQFNKDLVFIVDVTLLLFELIIIRRWGKVSFVRLAEDYLKTSKIYKDDSMSPLRRRLKIYKEITT